MGRASWPIHVVGRGRFIFTSKKQKAMGHLTEAQYKIIADRMIEEHRKYGDRLRPGHWADVAARKVASHMADFCEGERMYTESEVRAMVREMVYGVTAGEELTLDTIAAKHGVLLDPA